MMTAETFAAITDEDEEQLLLPEGWRLVRIGDVCQFIGGSQPPAHTFKRQPLPGYVRLVQIQDFRRDDVAVYIPKEEAKRSFDETDVMIGRYGPPVFQILRGLSGAYNVALIKTAPDESQLSKDYLFHLLKLDRIQTAVIKQSERSAGQSGVPKDFLENLIIPLPPTIEEQKRIAAVLDEQMNAVAQARAAVEAQLEAAQRLPNALLCSVFESEEARQWKIEKVGNISSLIVDGPHVTPYYVPKGIPFLTVRNIVNRRIDFSATSFVTEEDHEEFKKRGKAEKGDILYTKDGTLGIPCVVDTDREFSYFVSVALIKLIREKADPYFVSFVLESPSVLEQVKLLGAGAGLKHMVLKSIRSLEIPLPDTIEEQQEVVKKLTARMQEVEALKQSLTEQLAAINKMPAALLRKAFAGEI